MVLSFLRDLPFGVALHTKSLCTAWKAAATTVQTIPISEYEKKAKYRRDGISPYVHYRFHNGAIENIRVIRCKNNKTTTFNKILEKRLNFRCLFKTNRSNDISNTSGYNGIEMNYQLNNKISADRLTYRWYSWEYPCNRAAVAAAAIIVAMTVGESCSKRSSDRVRHNCKRFSRIKKYFAKESPVACKAQNNVENIAYTHDNIPVKSRSDNVVVVESRYSGGDIKSNNVNSNKNNAEGDRTDHPHIKGSRIQGGSTHHEKWDVDSNNYKDERIPTIIQNVSHTQAAIMNRDDARENVRVATAELGGSSSAETENNSSAATAHEPPWRAGKFIEGLPVYTAEEVAAHNGKKNVDSENELQDGNKVWVSYRSGVYDITDFIAIHPGGEARIRMAAGRSIDPFWRVYGQHNSSSVNTLLEEYRIGNLHPDAVAAAANAAKEGEEEKMKMYANEPDRSPLLIVHSNAPFNAETPTELLADRYITPTEIMYVRHHFPVPKLNPEGYKIEIEVEGVCTHEISLEDLQTKFNQLRIACSLQCAGNRRVGFTTKEVKGLPWKPGAIGTSYWTGCLLAEVLASIGVDESLARNNNLRHIHFEGWDGDSATGDHYIASIPLSRALCGHTRIVHTSPKGSKKKYKKNRRKSENVKVVSSWDSNDVILAMKMNDEDIPRDHGYPLRVIVPGYVGARSVKWLKKIKIAKYEAESLWQRRDYKLLPNSVSPSTTEEWSRFSSIGELPVQSAICTPSPSTNFHESQDLEIRGYAYSGGGRAIDRVEVSTDGGATWILTDVIRSEENDDDEIDDDEDDDDYNDNEDDDGNNDNYADDNDDDDNDDHGYSDGDDNGRDDDDTCNDDDDVDDGIDNGNDEDKHTNDDFQEDADNGDGDGHDTNDKDNDDNDDDDRNDDEDDEKYTNGGEAAEARLHNKSWAAVLWTTSIPLDKEFVDRLREQNQLNDHEKCTRSRSIGSIRPRENIQQSSAAPDLSVRSDGENQQAKPNATKPNAPLRLQLLCRAVDSSGNTQPECSGPLWNSRGCLNNSWHGVDVYVHPKMPANNSEVKK